MSDSNSFNIISLAQHLKESKEPLRPHAPVLNNKSTPSLAKKMAAFWADFCLILSVKTFCTISYGVFLEKYFFMLNNDQKSQLLIADLGLHLSLTLLIYFSYFVFCNYSMSGKTLGKYIFKLRTINDNFIFDKTQLNSDMDMTQSIRRAFGYLLCYLSFGTFFSFSFFSEDRRGLQDFFSGSRTVSDEWIESMMQYKLYESEVVVIDILQLPQAA